MHSARHGALQIVGIAAPAALHLQRPGLHARSPYAVVFPRYTHFTAASFIPFEP